MPKPERPQLATRLIAAGLLDAAGCDEALATIERHAGSFIRYLLDEALLPPSPLADIIAEEFDLPLLSGYQWQAQPTAINQVDPALIRRLRVLPLSQTDGSLQVAISDPTELGALDEISFQTGLPTEPMIVADDALSTQIAATLGRVDHGFETTTPTTATEVNDDRDDDTPVIRFVNRLLHQAMDDTASDVHIEPFEGFCRIRFRQDGILHEVATPPITMAGRIAARIKVMARLDIAERRIPQDGRLRLQNNAGDNVDFRVSTCPTLYGEKLVLRLLSTAENAPALDCLGLEPEQLAAYIHAIDRPHGMILVTGPTGSGKTVTLYSGLRRLNSTERNILTVEDPVEINLPGVNQVGINPKAGLDFPRTLRAFLRQDPDVIMVGEIRDRETADIAIKAAQTGHLVLSTLHTNDAPSAITRLLNMGIEPWNIVASVNLIIAQRLVRRLCAACGPEQAGCAQCTDGYHGRIGIYQLLPINANASSEILAGTTPVASEDLRSAGNKKIRQGLTSRSEVLRITNES
ncbi:MAG: Flp pilus assembly complex ATPase component TadA [Gammaproteobacteria bacterium]|nr:Flp pilus assembly complex ATPase component TadA [Gammaproteobacteria bacterium]